MSKAHDRLFNMLIGLGALCWAISELLTPAKNIIVMGVSVALLLSSGALMLGLPWAPKLFIAVAAWYIVQNFLFIAFSSHLNLTDYQAILLPVAIVLRSIQIVFFGFCIIFLRHNARSKP